jgi:hypothetical protein
VRAPGCVARHLISLAGFASFYWADPRVRMPTLRRLAERGSVAQRMECVFPSTNLADKVWKKVQNPDKSPYGRRGPENPNHYADIGLAIKGQKSLDAQTPDAGSLTPQTWIAYYDAIGFTQVRERGRLPFRVWQIYKKMVEFVAAKQVPRFVAAAGILAHYVGDACQPLRGSYLDATATWPACTWRTKLTCWTTRSARCSRRSTRPSAPIIIWR